MQSTCAHRFDLRRVRLDRKEEDVAPGEPFEVFEEGGPHASKLRRIFDRGVREDQNFWIEPEVIGSRVGNQIPVTVTVAQVE